MNRDCTLGFLAGVGTGVALAFYCSPRARDEARRNFEKKVKAGTDAMQQVQDKANEIVESGRAELKRQQEGLKNAVEAGKAAYLERTAE